jgi:hypothetical protein
MITRDDRDILRRALLAGPKTTQEIGAYGWDRGAWGKLKEFKSAGITDLVGNPKPPFGNMDALVWQLTDAGKLHLAAPEPEAATDRFLRFGAWCACERSCNTADRRLEAGVSVYECFPVGAYWRPIDSRALSKNYGTLRAGPWFLVSGDVQAGLGADGEPLLKKVLAVASLSWEPADGRFAVGDLGVFSHNGHPGYGTAAGCRCTGG